MCGITNTKVVILLVLKNFNIEYTDLGKKINPFAKSIFELYVDIANFGQSKSRIC